MAAVLLVAGCAQETITLGEREVRVTVADTVKERNVGLGVMDGLSDGEGMLFVYPEPQIAIFGIKDIAFPVEVVFIAEDDTVSAIVPLTPGDRDARAVSPTPVRYAVEVPQGWCGENGVVVGTVLTRD